MKQTKRGFTLIELMVVMAIIAVLAVLFFAAINLVRMQSRNSTRTADANQYKVALEAYFAAKGYYPANAAPNTAESVYYEHATATSATEALVDYLTGFRTWDVSANSESDNNNYRVQYCRLTNSTYSLFVVNEPGNLPTATTCAGADADGSGPGTALTALPAGSTDFSQK